jgi:hypothetical protein
MELLLVRGVSVETCERAVFVDKNGDFFFNKTVELGIFAFVF